MLVRVRNAETFEQVDIMTRRPNGDLLRLDSVPFDMRVAKMDFWVRLLPQNDIWLCDGV